MQRPDIDSVVQKTGVLPALPKVVDKVLGLINDPESDIDDISAAITTDQVLTFRVLKMANSAYFGFSRRVFSVREALAILGLNMTRNLVLAVSAFSIMNKEIAGYVLEKGGLWKHSITTAMLAKEIAERTKCCSSEKAFTTGLLHDIGKVVINTYIAPQLQEITELTLTKKVPFMKAEEAILGFNHAQLGGRVASYWKLPEDMVDAIEYHHEPVYAATDSKLAAVVHIADALCMIMGVGLGGDGLMYCVDGEALQLTGLKVYELDSLIAGVADTVSQNEEGLMRSI